MSWPLPFLAGRAAPAGIAVNGAVDVYLLVSVISNESVNLLIVGGSAGVVNITITA
jgi:hypothetical protein